MNKIYEAKLLDDLEFKVEAAKKWRATGIRTNLERIFKYIAFFNSLDEDVVFVEGRTINDIPIIAEFKDFIIPNSVRLVAGDRRYPDMLERDLKPEEFEFSYGEWMVLLTQFRGYFKKDLSSDMVMLSDLKLNKSVTDITDVVPVNGKVKYEGVPFIPIWLKDLYTPMFNSTAANLTIDLLFEYYVADMKF